MKRLLAALTLALLVSLVLAVGATGAPGSGGGNMDSASGTVNQFGAAQESFSAKSSSIGTDAQGHYKLTNPDQDPNFVLTGEIRCLRVSTSPVPGVGAQFEARGVFVDVRGGTIPFQGFILFGSDSGKFSNSSDTYSRVFTTTPQLEDSCAPPTLGSPVQNGEIIVKDAF
jgi:hypothetical protein